MKKNLTGTDADIEISLKEYGLAWTKDENEITFYYGIKRDDSEFIKFDWGSVSKDINLKQEYDWVDFKAVNSFTGQDTLTLPLSQQINDLISYYGYENVFGTSYTEGMTYAEVLKNA